MNVSVVSYELNNYIRKCTNYSCSFKFDRSHIGHAEKKKTLTYDVNADIIIPINQNGLD